MNAVTPLSPDAPRGPSRAARYQVTRRVTWVGIAVNLVLAAVKTITGVAGQSQALVADGIHSLSDLVTDAVVLLAARHAARGADHDHPYGHGRIETAATVMVGLLLLLTAVLIGHNAVVSLGAAARPGPPSLMTLLIALGSVAGKEALFHYTRHAGRAIGSRLLEANAWHHRSDALSSIVVGFGIGGALAGVVALDAVAALIVAVMIAKVGWDVIRDSLRELVDTGFDADTVAELRDEALAVDGVKHAHTFRSRWMGHRALVDLHIRVGSRMSVSEGHRIAEAVRLRLLDRLSRLADVMVHVDPEDDTDGGPSNALPLRTEICDRLRARMQGLEAADRIEGLTLHYLGGRVHLEIALRPSGPGTDAAAAAEALRRAAVADPEIGNVSVLERVAPMECNGDGACTSTVQTRDEKM
ncbi:MAG: cation diffusion facilitator family transporter [Halofilum sp. (in: g-proteobacteria)]